jgi:hypothetical protein
MKTYPPLLNGWLLEYKLDCRNSPPKAFSLYRFMPFFFAAPFPTVQRAKSLCVAKMPGQSKIKIKGLLSN